MRTITPHVVRKVRPPRFVEEVPADAPLWLRLHRAADGGIAQFLAAFNRYVDALRERIPEDELTMLVATRQGDRIIRQLAGAVLKEYRPPGGLTELEDAYVDIILTGAREALAEEPTDIERFDIAGRLNLENPYAVEYAQTMGSTLIREVSSETVDAVREIVASALRPESALHPRKQAKLIRQIVGLTVRQQVQVARYVDGLGTLTDHSLRMAERFAERLRRERALTIARTESIRAANAGVRVAGEEVARVAGVRRDSVRFTWITTPDDRLCERCASLSDMVVAIDDPGFSSEKQSVLVNAPPAHPRCRCAIARKVEDVS